jgi:dephospho-CoA kinase
MKSKKIKVAITGNIGSGKSTFSSFLKEKGYPVINADEVSKKILATDKEVRKKVITEFGEKSFSEDKINTEYIAEIVFPDKKKLQILNSILHPLVLKNIEQSFNELHQKNNIVFCETALLFEAKFKKMFDYVVLIIADYEIRKSRSVKNNKTDLEQFIKRNKNQIKDENKIERSDFVFYNNGSIEDLEKKSEILLLSLNSLIGKSK